MSYRLFTSMIVLCAVFCLTSCRDSPSTESSDDQSPPSTPEPVAKLTPPPSEPTPQPAERPQPLVVVDAESPEDQSPPAIPAPVAKPAPPADRPQPLALGEMAPDFTLPTPDQGSFHLSKQLEEGPVVVAALRGWPGYQCPICTRQVGAFIAEADALKAAGAHVVLVYPGPATQLAAHAQEFVGNTTLPANFSFVIDSDFGFTKRYGLRWDAPRETAYPSTFVVDREGIVRFAKVSQSHGGRAKMADVLTALVELK